MKLPCSGLVSRKSGRADLRAVGILEGFVDRLGDLRRKVCRCRVQGLPDLLKILTQFLDSFQLLEEHGPGALVRSLERVGLSQEFPVALACEGKGGLGDVVSCSHGSHTAKARQG